MSKQKSLEDGQAFSMSHVVAPFQTPDSTIIGGFFSLSQKKRA
jgi:hypothetical protein